MAMICPNMPFESIVVGKAKDVTDQTIVLEKFAANDAASSLTNPTIILCFPGIGDLRNQFRFLGPLLSSPKP
jgi:hypothetical protein